LGAGVLTLGSAPPLLADMQQSCTAGATSEARSEYYVVGYFGDDPRFGLGRHPTAVLAIIEIDRIQIR